MEQQTHFDDSAVSTVQQQDTENDTQLSETASVSTTNPNAISIVTAPFEGIAMDQSTSIVSNTDDNDRECDELQQHVLNRVAVESNSIFTNSDSQVPLRLSTTDDDANDRVLEGDGTIIGDGSDRHRPMAMTSLNDDDIINTIMVPRNRPLTAGSTSSSCSLHYLPKYNKSNHLKNIVAAGGRTILFGVTSAQGPRKTMEDTHCARLCCPQNTAANRQNADTPEEESGKENKKMETCDSDIYLVESFSATPCVAADYHLDPESDKDEVKLSPTNPTPTNLAEKEKEVELFNLTRSSHHGEELVLSDNDDNEDIHQIPFFAVYDGHGGTKCSEYLKAHLENLALSHPYILLNPEVALTEAIERVDREFLSAVDGSADGSADDWTHSCDTEDSSQVESPSNSRADLEKRKKKKSCDLWPSDVLKPTHSSQILLRQSSALSSRSPTSDSKSSIILAGKPVHPYEKIRPISLADIDPSGSTAAVVVIVGNKIITANVGDTEVVMSNTHTNVKCENKSDYILLSCKHSLKDNPTEQERVKCAGGRIHQNRLGHPHYSPALLNLGVCRAIGDAGFKLPCFTNPQLLMSLMKGGDEDNNEEKPVHEGKPSGLIATPSTSVVELVPRRGHGLNNHTEEVTPGNITVRDDDEKEQIIHDFIIIGCDGLWDVVSYQEAVDHCRGFLIDYSPNDHYNVNSNNTGECDNNRNPAQEACDSLVKLALAKGSSDNVTVLVVVILGGNNTGKI